MEPLGAASRVHSCRGSPHLRHHNRRILEDLKVISEPPLSLTMEVHNEGELQDFFKRSTELKLKELPWNTHKEQRWSKSKRTKQKLPLRDFRNLPIRTENSTYSVYPHTKFVAIDQSRLDPLSLSKIDRFAIKQIVDRSSWNIPPRIVNLFRHCARTTSQLSPSSQS